MLPPFKKALDCKQVYKIKLKFDGTIERYKARLIILGNTQVEGEDFTKTFALAAKLVTVRTLLVMVVTRGWDIQQMDVHNTCLYSDLDEEVYMNTTRISDQYSKCSLFTPEIFVWSETSPQALVF